MARNRAAERTRAREIILGALVGMLPEDRQIVLEDVEFQLADAPPRAAVRRARTPQPPAVMPSQATLPSPAVTLPSVVAPSPVTPRPEEIPPNPTSDDEGPPDVAGMRLGKRRVNALGLLNKIPSAEYPQICKAVYGTDTPDVRGTAASLMNELKKNGLVDSKSPGKFFITAAGRSLIARVTGPLNGVKEVDR